MEHDMKNENWMNLKTLRDELKLQGHLFNMEVKDQWDNLEKKFSRMNQKLDNTMEVTGEVNKEIWETNKLMIEELKEGYQRIKKSLKS